jgi:hypothetical protein
METFLCVRVHNMPRRTKYELQLIDWGTRASIQFKCWSFFFFSGRYTERNHLCRKPGLQSNSSWGNRHRHLASYETPNFPCVLTFHIRVYGSVFLTTKFVIYSSSAHTKIRERFIEPLRNLQLPQQLSLKNCNVHERRLRSRLTKRQHSFSVFRVYSARNDNILTGICEVCCTTQRKYL